MASVPTRASSSKAKIVIALVVIIDQVTKHWMLSELSNNRVVNLFWTLRFNLVFNSGMAFSQGQGAGRIIGLFAIGIIIWLWRSLAKATSSGSLIGTALLIGGALGNVVDRVFRGDAWLGGAVVDFIDLQWFPVFNIADSSVTIGAAILIFSSLKKARSIKSAGAQS